MDDFIFDFQFFKPAAERVKTTKVAKAKPTRATPEKPTTPQRRLLPHRGMPLSYIHLLRTCTCATCGECTTTCEGEFVEFRNDKQALTQWVLREQLLDYERAQIVAALPERLEFHDTSVLECPSCIFTRMAAEDAEPTPVVVRQFDLFGSAQA